ncbi:hypothetical protein [Gracilibacillus phocaeensis]|uniref:hypothetical protein n=1 Tax=Gracilibacillus phocaeensis TaxID=2042304 RepID=UPI0013EF4506|nr:hypothetical protein [Gracilibacillus phocaeensis]
MSGIKLKHFTEGKNDRVPQNPSIHDAFLNHQRNVFFIEIGDGLKNLYFVIEYPNDDPLAAYTVDQER